MAFTDFVNSVFNGSQEKESGDMYLRRVGNGIIAHYELHSTFTEKVEWVSTETDNDGNPVSVRVPNESTIEYSRQRKFTVAGKTYRNLNHFLIKAEGEWAVDIYGRKVLCTKERFPCFDSYDYLHEDRYYRWFFIRRGNSVSQVFVTDGRDKIYVTEDLQYIEGWAWTQMQKLGFCQPHQNAK